MAGIEGVSAIITVVQVGFALSKALIEYVDEVKDASSRIRRVGNEIRTTSERLQDIGKLVEQNPITNVFSSEGLQSAIRASDECGQVIGELRMILSKGGYTPSPTVVQKEEIDISYFTKFKWPFVKSRLEVPRAELQRIKTDLTLLFTSVMAISASTEADKKFYCAEIVNVEKTRKWAALKARKARQRARKADRKGDRVSLYRDASVASFSDDEEDERILSEFMQFKEEQAITQEKQRQDERLALLRLKEDARREAEAKERNEIETMGVVKYKEALKRQLAKQESRNSATKEALRAELERLNFPSTQMQSILDNINVATNDDTDSDISLHGLGHDLTANAHSPASQPNSNGMFGSTKSKRKFRWTLWKHTKHSSNLLGSPPPARGSPRSPLILGVWDDSVMIESWVYDSSSILWSEFKESHSANGSKQEPQQFWNRYSQLPPETRTSFQNFYSRKNEDLTDQEKWVILSLEPIKRVFRTGIFSRTEEEIGLRVLVARKDVGRSTSGVAVPNERGNEESTVSPIDDPGKALPPLDTPYQSAEARGQYVAESRKVDPERPFEAPARVNYSPRREYHESKPRRARDVKIDDIYSSDIDNHSSRDFIVGRRRGRLRTDETRIRDRTANNTSPYRRSSGIYPRSRTRDQLQLSYRPYSSSHRPSREKSMGDRFYERNRSAFRRDSRRSKNWNTSHFTDDKDLFDDDKWNSDRSFVRVRRHQRQTSPDDEDILDRTLEKQRGNQKAKASGEMALVLSTLNRLTTYQGSELPPRRSTTFSTDPMPTTIVGARRPLNPAPFSAYEHQGPSNGHTLNPFSHDPFRVANHNPETNLDKKYQENGGSSKPSVHRSRPYRHGDVVLANDTNRDGRPLLITAPPDPQISISGPSPTVPRSAPHRIYDSPVSIGHTASAGSSSSDTSSDEESTHSSPRPRHRHRQTSGDDTDDVNRYIKGKKREVESENKANGII
ncbi:hypothetical protein ACJ72_07139 [Emergomyces africanus]|uniref:Fungal N-terminal domain-containing protein n=1 Tax=Emergomyces africanus TaxID=1955775 RepID=A0A1B7NP09_9EURO|nr:hypothetical protein ACJ72_07139 [Emergomyces africanus]